jgi:DNA end-binding protein Ku
MAADTTSAPSSARSENAFVMASRTGCEARARSSRAFTRRDRVRSRHGATRRDVLRQLGTPLAVLRTMPARAIDTATISFGLVSIPVKIYSTSEPSHEIHFHLIHEGCGERLHQQYVCPRHGVVEREETSKGFELTKGNFVELEKDELEALEAVSTDEISIREFVPVSAVDPLFVERTYYLGPDKGGERAYALLRDALADAELAGIATFSARGKQYIEMVRPFHDGLAMHQLRYLDEVKPWSEVPLGKLPKPTPAELQLASQIVHQLAHDTFDASQYHDEVKERVRELIAKKAKGGEIVAAPEAPKPVVTDLMAALKATLAGERVEARPGDRVSVVKNGRRAARGHRPTPKRTAHVRPHAARARRTGPHGRPAHG